MTTYIGIKMRGFDRVIAIPAELAPAVLDRMVVLEEGEYNPDAGEYVLEKSAKGTGLVLISQEKMTALEVRAKLKGDTQ